MCGKRKQENLLLYLIPLTKRIINLLWLGIPYMLGSLRLRPGQRLPDHTLQLWRGGGQHRWVQLLRRRLPLRRAALVGIGGGCEHGLWGERWFGGQWRLGLLQVGRGSPRGRVAGAILQDIVVVAYIIMGYLGCYNIFI